MKYSNALLGITVCLFLFTFNDAFSQCGTNCSVACNGQINVSLGKGCETLFTPGMGGKNVTPANVHCYTAEVFDHYNRPIPGNLLTLKHLNQLWTYKVTETECNNHCWGKVLVEYKLGPQIACPDDMTIDCNALSFLEPPVPSDLCAAVSMVMTSERYEDLNCDVLHQSKIIRTYKATDEYGNTTNCSHNIYLRRLPLAEIIFPTTTVVSCSDPHIQYDDEGFPRPWVFQSIVDADSQFGVPFLCQQDLVTEFKCPYTGTYGTGTGMGTTVVDYTYPGGTDYYGIPLFPDDGGIVTIETGDILEPYKTYEVKNPKTSHHCGAGVVYTDREIPRAKTPCTRKIMRSWEVIEWWCSDELAVGATQIIEIKDDVAPTIACPSDQTVNSTENCYAELLLPSAYVQDACNPDVEVIISYGTTELEGNGGMAHLIHGTTTLTYVVSDACGNSAECETTISVIDYATPIAICEDEKIVSLAASEYTKVPAYVFDNGSYDDCTIAKIEVRRVDSDCHPDAKEWSEYAYFCCSDATVPEVLLEFKVTDAAGNFGACQVNVVVQDKAVPIVNCPPNMEIDCHVLYDANDMGAVFGYGVIEDNCVSAIPHEVISSDFDQCGVGLMTRSLQSLDIDGNVLSSCDQRIRIYNDDPFTKEDIYWPSDLVLKDRCGADGLEPENLEDPYSFPHYNEAKCALVGFDYKDEIYSYSSQGNGECLTISRTWTAINWCAGDEEFEKYTIPYPQLIKIKNVNHPELDNAGDVVVETVNDCNNGFIDVTRTATDDCDESFYWEYHVTEFPTGDTLVSGTENHIEGKMPVGNYVIHWTVLDKCGNASYHNQSLKVVSKKAPTPVCHNGIAASLSTLDVNGDPFVTLWASDFDAGSYPACNGTLAFSLSADITDRNVVFNCNDLGDQQIQLWVTDVVTGAQDFCVASIEIQDRGLCPDGFRIINVAGKVKTEALQEVKDVEVALKGTAAMVLTNASGSYEFADMPSGGSYVVEPNLDVNYLNGVSTVDLIKIQRHILGVEKLESPYKMIAADINNSGTINGIDLIELRKLILGIYTALPSNDSWRFVSNDYTFLNPLNPWAETWEEDYTIATLSNDMVIDFVGVKIGDVDDSVAFSTSTRTSSTNTKTVDIRAAYEAIAKGEEALINFSAQADNEIIGMQGTLEFDPQKVEILSVEPRGLDIKYDTHFYTAKQEQGWMTFSYNGDKKELIDNSLFDVVIRAKEDIQSTENLFSISSKNTRAEVYMQDFSAKQINLISKNHIEKAEIISVSPNPWVSLADIQIRTPHAAFCDLEFIDINGKLIYKMTTNLSAGTNAIAVTRQEVPASGLVYIRMTVGGESSEYKMMVY